MKGMLTSIALTVVLALTGSQAWATTATPMQLLKDTQKKVEAILEKKIAPKDAQGKKQREEDIKKIVRPFFNYSMLAKQTLGKHWDGLKPEQRKLFVFWFRELLQQAYINGIRDRRVNKKNREKVKLNYRKEKVSGKRATVFTRVKYKVKRRNRMRWKKVRIDWDFIKVGDKWKVKDITTNDTSLMETYQENFDKIIRKKSFKRLIEKISKKVNELRKKQNLPAITGPTK